MNALKTLLANQDSNALGFVTRCLIGLRQKFAGNSLTSSIMSHFIE